MTESIARDLAERTGGACMLGVVGPVRTGKSTFIKRFMEILVLPRMPEGYLRERARDELPQSGSGRSIMTAEPKFVRSLSPWEKTAACPYGWWTAWATWWRGPQARRRTAGNGWSPPPGSMKRSP